MDNAVIIKKVVGIIRQHANPERIWLFGSHAVGENRAGSDIDIAFTDEQVVDMDRIKSEVAQLPTLVRVDVCNIAGKNGRFSNRVRDTGRVLFSATKKLRAEDGLYNFSKALERFGSMIDRRKQMIEDGYGDIYLDLAVMRFEFTYEMGWKSIKRYVEFLGLECKNPRACIMEAYAQEIVIDQITWLDMIEMRNRTSHTYDELEISELLGKLKQYRTVFVDLQKTIEVGL